MSESTGRLLAGLLLFSVAVQAARDPTQPPGYGVAPAPAENGAQDEITLRLSGIISGPGGRSALIDGRRLYPGDRIADARVLSIGPDQVALERRGQRIVIRLLSADVKRSSVSAMGSE